MVILAATELLRASFNDFLFFAVFFSFGFNLLYLNLIDYAGGHGYSGGYGAGHSSGGHTTVKVIKVIDAGTTSYGGGGYEGGRLSNSKLNQCVESDGFFNDFTQVTQVETLAGHKEVVVAGRQPLQALDGRKAEAADGQQAVVPAADGNHLAGKHTNAS